MKMRINITVLLSGILAFCIRSVSAVNIEMVTVGNPGNAPDPTTGYGRVDYEYQIGKYEITQGQYTEFLNAAARDDPNQLFYPAMGFTRSQGGIQQTGSAPNYSYSVAPDWADRPISWVNFWTAARFANWLHNGQPTGPQGPGTTENGAYHDIGNDSLFGRNANAKFFIPTENEWYKAAYHDKNAGFADSYFYFPTHSNNPPGIDMTEITRPGNNANSYALGGIHPGYRITLVGEFELSQSPYETFDQGGNVEEWTEATAYLNSYRTVRGGSFTEGTGSIQSMTRRGIPTTIHYEFTGFRIAAAAPVPEPTCLALFSIAAMMLGSRFRMRQA
jgi:formylglycine-generating enzyme required for sulfatase activity